MAERGSSSVPIGMLALVGLFVAIAAVLYWYSICTHGYWKKRGVPFLKPTPFVGNMGSMIAMKKSMGQAYGDIYNAFPDCPYVGVFKIRQPAILIRDPTLLQHVMVKDFSSFHDNDIDVDEKNDPILAKNPFVLKGQKWKTVRNQLTLSFTPAKIKTLYPLMTVVGRRLIRYIEETPDATSKDGINAKDLSVKFTTDVVASVAFGLEGNSFDDPNAKFLELGRKIMSPGTMMAIKIMIVFLCPSVARLINASFFSPEVNKEFKEIVLSTVEYREKNKIARKDFLDLMIQTKAKPGDYDFTDEDMVSHSASFFADGFETSSTALSFLLYEIANNPIVQKRLQDEIDETITKHGGKLTYEGLMEMSYLDNTMNESLRLYPPAPILAKLVTEPYTLDPIPPSKKSTTLAVGTPVLIPVYSLQRDPNYWPEPEKFDPDRFSEENKDSIRKCTFMPFGDGPRICLGNRLATAQVKTAVVSILSQYDIRVSPKTKRPLEMDPKYFLLAPIGGLWLNMHKRKNIVHMTI